MLIKSVQSLAQNHCAMSYVTTNYVLDVTKWLYTRSKDRVKYHVSVTANHEGDHYGSQIRKYFILLYNT